jgi:hypothetical protein
MQKYNAKFKKLSDGDVIVDGEHGKEDPPRIVADFADGKE